MRTPLDPQDRGHARREVNKRAIANLSMLANGARAVIGRMSAAAMSAIRLTGLTGTTVASGRLRAIVARVFAPDSRFAAPWPLLPGTPPNASLSPVCPEIVTSNGKTFSQTDAFSKGRPRAFRRNRLSPACRNTLMATKRGSTGRRCQDTCTKTRASAQYVGHTLQNWVVEPIGPSVSHCPATRRRNRFGHGYSHGEDFSGRQAYMCCEGRPMA